MDELSNINAVAMSRNATRLNLAVLKVGCV